MLSTQFAAKAVAVKAVPGFAVFATKRACACSREMGALSRGNVMLLSCMIMGERVGGRDKNKGLPLSCHITKAHSLHGGRNYKIRRVI